MRGTVRQTLTVVALLSNNVGEAMPPLLVKIIEDPHPGGEKGPLPVPRGAGKR